MDSELISDCLEKIGLVATVVFLQFLCFCTIQFFAVVSSATDDEKITSGERIFINNAVYVCKELEIVE